MSSELASLLCYSTETLFLAINMTSFDCFSWQETNLHLMSDTLQTENWGFMNGYHIAVNFHVNYFLFIENIAFDASWN